MYNNPYLGNGQYMYGQPYNQFYNQSMQNQNMQKPQEQYQSTNYVNRQTGLQGKSVDNIEVVKATDIPLDGSISYFPLTDGTGIVSKQIQMDGTSKIIVYRPEKETEKAVVPQYITKEELEEKLKTIGKKDDYKDEIKTIKRTVEDLKDDIDRIKSKK